MCDHYPILRKSVSLDDFGEVEANFLDHIEEEFENQLDTMLNSLTLHILLFRSFLCLISKLHVVNLISMVFHLCMLKNKKKKYFNTNLLL
jgi:hypothetical protein